MAGMAPRADAVRRPYVCGRSAAVTSRVPGVSHTLSGRTNSEAYTPGGRDLARVRTKARTFLPGLSPSPFLSQPSPGIVYKFDDFVSLSTVSVHLERDGGGPLVLQKQGLGSCAATRSAVVQVRGPWQTAPVAWRMVPPPAVLSPRVLCASVPQCMLRQALLAPASASACRGGATLVTVRQHRV